MTGRLKLGEILVGAGILTAEQLEEALGHQELQPTRPRLGAVIIELGFATEDEVAAALAEQMSIPFIDLARVVPDPVVIRAIPRRLAEHHLVVGIERSPSGALVVAAADPSNVVAFDDLRIATGLRDIRPMVATLSAIRQAIHRAYGIDSAAAQALVGEKTLEELAASRLAPRTDDPEVLRQQTEMAPIVQLVNSILAEAVKARATDIHVEPQPLDLRVRYRVDGLLRDVVRLPGQIQGAVLSRVKIMSGMDIAERRRPQDGRATIRVDGRQIDTRVSTLPALFGEKAVIRLLPEGEGFVPLEGLGLEPDQLVELERHLGAPQGLIVFTGPTGSGKTTSMYSALTRLLTPELNIVTLEDPVEYQVAGVNQLQIDERTGVTFPKALRAVLRQDPDTILVGEIRDPETARIVMQASMTGHLVLTTLHTNDAPSAITRLVDMGVEPYLVASAVSLVIAQRLIRTVCDRCREPAMPSERTLRQLGLSPESLRGNELVAGSGCQACGYLGYRGRTGIHEVLPITSAIRERIAASTSPAVLAVAARAEGMRPLRESAIRKVLSGVTTLDELVRVTQFDQADLRQCPDCRAAVEEEFKVCPYCRAKLGARGCPSCGRPVRPDWQLCPYCEASLADHAAAAVERPRVLAVEDDPSVAGLLELILKEDAEVVVAREAKQAVQLASREPPDLVLLDLRLPDLPGIEVLRWLRAQPSTREVPVIVLTGFDDEAAEVECLEAGVDDFLRKPFQEDVLRARIGAALRRSRARS